MSQHYEQHAEKVVKAFKEILSDEARAAIQAEEYDQLSMLIESAISTSALSAVEKVADQLDALAHQVRNAAEHYD